MASAACCAPAEEKPQRGLGIRESVLDGVAHRAILAACQLHPAGRLQRPDDLQLDAELGEQIRGQPLVPRVDAQHGRGGQRRQALAQQRAQHRGIAASSREWLRAVRAPPRDTREMPPRALDARRPRRRAGHVRAAPQPPREARPRPLEEPPPRSRRASACAASPMRITSALVSASSWASSAAASAFSPARRSDSAIGSEEDDDHRGDGEAEDDHRLGDRHHQDRTPGQLGFLGDRGHRGRADARLSEPRSDRAEADCETCA